MEQAELLADLEANMTFHATLVYRGSRENADKFLAVQEQYFTKESEVDSGSDTEQSGEQNNNTEQNGSDTNAE